MTGTPAPGVTDAPARYAVLTALCAGGLALGLAHLIAPAVGLLTIVLVLVGGLGLPRLLPGLATDSAQRSGVALLLVAGLVAATAASGSRALGSGSSDASGDPGGLAMAAHELALPSSVPIGLLAALAAGALVAVTLEIVDRRGVQSALVLSVAVLGLTAVASPGQKLVLPFAIGWPAALFALTRLAASPALGEPVMTVRSARTGPFTRWQIAPVVIALAAACTVLSALVLSGVSAIGTRAVDWDSFNQGGAGAGARSTSSYLGGAMDLNARGPLDDTPLVDVPAKAPRLWRAATLDAYDGRSWEAAVPFDQLPAVVGDGTPQTAKVVPDRGTPLGRPGPTRTDRVRPLMRGTVQVLAPGRLLDISSSVLAVGGAAKAYAGDRVTLAFSSEYIVRSEPLPDADDPADATRLRHAAVTGGDLADPRWTALPAEVPLRVKTLGQQLVNAAPSRLRAVQAIEHELHRRITYQLDSPVPPDGVDAVDDALFTSHQGFCEQFASAEVVLLRAAGIPARMAVGFSAAGPVSGGTRALRRSDAHAWVEVWFPSVGWVSSDPTPAGEASSSPWYTPFSRWFAAHWRALSVTGAVGVLLLGLALFPRRTKREELRVDPALAAAFARLETDLAAVGAGRDPTETVAALSRRVSPDLREPLLVLERALYAPSPPTREECVAAAAAMDGRTSVSPGQPAGPGSRSPGPARGRPSRSAAERR